MADAHFFYHQFFCASFFLTHRKGFMVFSGGVKWEHWSEMGQKNYGSLFTLRLLSFFNDRPTLIEILKISKLTLRWYTMMHAYSQSIRNGERDDPHKNH